MDAPSAAQVEERSARPVRKWFAWSLDEVSGSLGDLGTFLPHIIGAITVVGMDPTGIFVTFGLFNALAGSFYGIPMAVQPMKAASAAVLIQPMDPGAVAGAGLVIGAFFLLMGATGLVSRVARALPPTVAAGLQLGLGLSLAALGIRLVEKQIGLGIAVCALMLLLMRSPACPSRWSRSWRSRLRCRDWTLAAVSAPGFRHSPAAAGMADLASGCQRHRICRPAAIPLTLTNAITVTAAVSRQMFPDGPHRADERTLAVTTGLGNLIAAPFGGYLMCHGAGGIAGHVRFGARIATAPVLLGLVFLGLGIFLGGSGYELLRTIPEAVLGGLLLFSKLDLAQSSKPGNHKDADLFIVLLMAAVGIAVNPAAAFAVGLPLVYGVRHGLLRF